MYKFKISIIIEVPQIMRISFYLIVISIITGVGCITVQPAITLPAVVLTDSLSVKSYIERATVCDRLSFVEENKRRFCEEGYSDMILSSIVRDTGGQVFIPFYSNGSRVSNRLQEKHLQEQIDNLKVKVGCVSKKL